MRAIIVRQFGDPALLKTEEVPTPTPRDGEALVEIKSAGINPSDLRNIQGLMHGTTLPRIPGRDFAGIVARGPANLLGQEVWGTGGDIGFTRDGSHTQYILLPAAALTPKPKTLSLDAAGTAGLIFVTAWSALITAADVSRGDTVLIIGAAGGVGSAAVQIVHWRGAKIIAAVRCDEDTALARAAGADHVINTRSANLLATVAEISNARGPTVIFDTTGQMFSDAIEIAAHNARILVISAPQDGKSTFNLRTVYRKELNILGIDTRQLDAIACAKLLTEMRPAFESNDFKPPPAQPRPLSVAADAYSQAAQSKGHFYLRPND